MKKLVPALLCLCLLLGGCAGEAGPTPSPTPEPTPLVEPTSTPEPIPSGSPVYTDWSKLEPYEPQRPVYTRRYEERTEELIPADDYGPLIFFAGISITGMEEWDGWTDYYDFHLYGLVTTKGEVVVDPVYSSVIRLCETDSWGNMVFDPGVMLLGKVFYDAEGNPEERFALCDGQGRWRTDYLYDYLWDGVYANTSFAWGVPLYALDGNMEFRDPDTGELTRTLDIAAQVGVSDFSTSSFEIDPASGWVTVEVYHWSEEDQESKSWAIVFEPDGQAHTLPSDLQWAMGYREGLVLASVFIPDGDNSQYRWGYLDPLTGEWAIEPRFTEAALFVNGAAPVNDGWSIYFINTAGAALTEDLGSMPQYVNGFWSTGEGRLDADLKPARIFPVSGVNSVTHQGDGWYSGWTWEGAVLARGEEFYRFPADLGEITGCRDGRVLFAGERIGEDTQRFTLTDLEGNVIAQWEEYSFGYLSWDMVTGEGYLRMYAYQQNKDALYDLNGKCLDQSGEYTYLEGGLVYHYNEDYTTLTDKEGKVVFYWSFFPNGD